MRLLRILFLFYQLLPHFVGAATWTSTQFPDLRGSSVSQCVRAMPHGQSLYICDPDNILNTSQALALNRQLHELSLGTKCQCQRKSQCITKNGLEESSHGFVVSIAVVSNLQMTIHSPSEVQLTERAESFTKALEGRWALGDCGNSVIIFVWEHYKKMVIWPARLAEKYVSVEERKKMLLKVNHLVQTDKWHEALSTVIVDIGRELTGEREQRTDTGTLALVASVAMAVALTLIITCCVCAFRCCGNLKGDERPRGVLAAAHRVDSVRALVMRRGSQLRRSFSKSPKFPLTRNAPNRFFADTTIV
ncbi:unnamed protein product, partial [Mesorhabditis belari]|uniref:Uncharacterized protein n=1 Tax=Mesorhabditis belari TaxID=2138241 RepID=A0AAF3E7L8_9BILA